MRTLLKFLIGLALLLAAIAGLYLYERFKIAQFYDGRPVLNELAASHDNVWSDDSAAIRQTLLRLFPIGTDKERIRSVLSNEDFGCQQTLSGVRIVSGDAVRQKPDYLDCQLLVPAFIGSRHWIIDLWFDNHDRLTGVRAAIWNIWM